MQNPVILCVDDDLDGLIGREALLRQKGYDVLVTTNPHEALRLFASCHIDGVVLDYRMPEMFGDAVAAWMKQRKPEIPIMLLSADDEMPEELSDEVDMFCSKRQLPSEFVAALQILLARGRHSFSTWLRDWKRKLAAA